MASGADAFGFSHFVKTFIFSKKIPLIRIYREIMLLYLQYTIHMTPISFQ